MTPEVGPASSRASSPRSTRTRRRGRAWTLPASLSSFVGRGRELEALMALLDGSARLVTIFGPGGIGKTRLALEAARRLARDRVPVAFCDLAEASNREELVSAIATALGYSAGGMSSAGLAAHVGSSLAREGRCVVVLDNFEQLSTDAPLLTTWLAEAPNAAFVVTTRERLRVVGEHVVEVMPLGHVGDAVAGDPRDCDAVRLLFERARAASSSFELRSGDLAAAAEVVRAVDGIPLAIELCAARLGVIGLAELRDQLAGGTLFVTGGVRGAPARHATLRATIEWSWRLLTPELRETLARCSIFHGGFRLDAVRSVLDLPASARGTAAALERMQALHDRSLVRVVVAASRGERRFALYESVREFAAERLAESGALDRVRALHVTHYLSRGRALAADADGTDGRRARDDLVLESANLMAVARGASSPIDALTALLALESIFSERGPLDPYADALDRAIASALVGEVRCRALLARARLDITRGRFDDAIALFARAREEGRAIGDAGVVALATSKLAVLSAFLDRTDTDATFDEAESMARTENDPRLRGICLSDRASALSRDGREREALEARELAVQCFTRAGDAHRRAVALGYLGSSCLAVGRLADAERYTAEAVDELRLLGDARTEGQVRGFLARARHGSGRTGEARAVLRAALSCLVSVGERWFGGVYEGWLGDTALEDGLFAEAVRAYERAIAALDLAGERPYGALFRAALAVAQIPVDPAYGVPDVDTAILPRTIGAAVRLHLAHAAVFRARRADERGALSDAVNAAHAAIADASDSEGLSDDVRFAARLLRRTLDALETSTDRDVLTVGADARWFERTGKPRVRLDRHRSIRLILARLVEARLTAPGKALSREALIDAGWPGERIRADAAANRLNVSLTRLKRLGLRDLLCTRDDGLLLDPGVPCNCKKV